jgi:hypothetical protein
MAQRDFTQALKWGVTLIRHYDNAYNLTQQCGPFSYYQAMEDQLLADALEAYCRCDSTGALVGPCDVLKGGTWHIWSGLLPRPTDWDASHGAYCRGPVNGSERHIWIPYIDPTTDGANGYRMPAALSHEMGHALHQLAWLWVGVPALREVEVHFERLFAQSGAAYDPQVFPWRQASGQQESPAEQFANAYRALLGIDCTRGESGTTMDPVLPGFNCPLTIAGLKKRMQLLPGLSAFVRKFGMLPGTLRWQHQGDAAAGWWEFRRATDGVLVAQTAERDWHQSINNTWAPYSPGYSL